MTTTVTETVAETECDLAGVLTCQACGARRHPHRRHPVRDLPHLP